MRRKTAFNRIFSVVIIIGFLFLAFTVIDNAHLLEDPGTLEKNLTVPAPEGYERVEEKSSEDQLCLARETGDTSETLEVEYYGFEDYSSSGGEEFEIDGDTTAYLHVFDWDHSVDNSLNCYVMRDGMCYEVSYRCRDKTKSRSGEAYYSSCSPGQQKELMAFIRSFEFHDPAPLEGNVFVRLFRSLGVGGCVVFGAAILIFVGMPVAMGLGGLSGGRKAGAAGDAEGAGTAGEGTGGDTGSGTAGAAGAAGDPGEDRPIRSSDLHAEMNRERERRGEESLPSINTVQGTSTNTLARRDHSWSSVPDFFVKLARSEGKTADGGKPKDEPEPPRPEQEDDR